MSGAQGRVRISETQYPSYVNSPWQHGSNYNHMFTELGEIIPHKGVITVVEGNANVNLGIPVISKPAIYIETGTGIRPEIVIDEFVINAQLFTDIREEINLIKESIKEIREIVLELQYAPGGKFYNEAESDFKKLIKE